MTDPVTAAVSVRPDEESMHRPTVRPGGNSYTRILAGSGRSGTTWLLDVLCEANRLRPVFEPLHPAAWRLARQFSYKYAAKDEAWSDLERFWSAVYAARYSGIWSNYRIRPDRLRPSLQLITSWSACKRYIARWHKLYRNRLQYGPQKRYTESLIKVIRANLMVPWLAAKNQMKIAFVIRHPAAVIESQLRLRIDWNAHSIARLYSDDERLDRRLGVRWRDLYKTAANDAELLTMIWCLENIVPLQDCRQSDNVTFLFYEDLASHDANAWKQLLASLKLEEAPSSELLMRPSQQASSALGRTSIDQSHMGDCLERLNTVDRNSIQRVLERFGVGFYNVGSIVPVRAEMRSANTDSWPKTLLRSA